MIIKGKTKIILGVLFVLISMTSVRSQAVRLNGKITNSATGEAIQMGHVRVGDIITYSNHDGDFSLRIPSASKGKLEVFHMGFDTYEADIKTEGTYDIKLEPIAPTKELHDSVTANHIMKEVFLRFHMNYEHAEQLLLSYYTESVWGEREIYYFAEGVMEILLPSNVDNGPSMVRPLKTRTRNIKPYGHSGVDDLSGHATEMVQSSIWMPNSFLEPKNRWSYNYEYEGMEVHRNEHVFIIKFAPKEAKKGFVSGVLYVDELSHAIIRIEYDTEINDHWDTEHWVEEFQHHDHTYYLLRASHETTWKEDGKLFTFTSLIVNTEVEPNRQNIAWEKFLLGKEFYFPLENTGNFNDEFWGNYNYMVLDEEERAQLIKK